MQAVVQHSTLSMAYPVIGGRGKMWVRVLGHGHQVPCQLSWNLLQHWSPGSDNAKVK